MTAHYYAEINSQLICHAVTQTAGVSSNANMIPIPSYDTSLLGKVWTGTTWEDPAPEPDPEP